jgi:glycerate 2-kinase
MNARRTLLELFDAALRAVDGRAAVARALRDTTLDSPVALFAIGKAASSMTLGAFDTLGGRIESAHVITKDGHADPALARDHCCTVLQSAHPVPDQRSLVAGEALISRLRALDGGVMPLFLVSGGSSSVVEALHDGFTLEDLRALNQRGLASGWDIGTLNAQRATLSRIKAGGIARLLAGRAACALFISDVPGDDVDVIGSGLLGRDAGRNDAIERRVVANVETALAAVDDAARSRGIELERRAARFDGEAADVAREFVAALRDTHADGIVWGGESTVTLPVRAGRGGRNTHLALAAARLLRAKEAVMILAAGTDGTDGPTEDAGAIIDALTVERAEIGGVDVDRALREFDSGTALEAAADLVHTGPTGTNVGDLLLGLKVSAASLRDAPRGRVV